MTVCVIVFCSELQKFYSSKRQPALVSAQRRLKLIVVYGCCTAVHVRYLLRPSRLIEKKLRSSSYSAHNLLAVYT